MIQQNVNNEAELSTTLHSISNAGSDRYLVKTSFHFKWAV